jgi:dTMP kinase
LVRQANRLATGDLVPDVTVLLDLPVRDGLARVARRGSQDRIEQSGSGFHDRVAAAFAKFEDSSWQQAHPECGPVVLVDASGAVGEVHARVIHALHERWPETFPAEMESHKDTMNSTVA